MINLLIAGYHGYGNCGDEATLMAMTTNIKEIAPDVNITAISHIPELTKTEYKINSVQRFNAFQVMKAIVNSDIILSGGGTLIQNGTSTRSLVYYLSIIKFAKLFHKRVMLYSNGIGPVTGKLNRKLVKLVVDNVDFITLREEFSKKDLMDMGVIKPQIKVTADAAFTLKTATDKRALEILDIENIPLDKDLVGVSIRNWNKAKYGDHYLKELALVCDNEIRKGRNILFIPMEQPKDLDISKKVIEYMKEQPFLLKNAYKPDEILAVIGQTNLMIAMRLHALLFSAQKKIPIIGIVYDPKIEYYLDVLDMPKGGDVTCDKLNADIINNRVDEMFENYDKYRTELEIKVDNLLKQASKNEDYLKEQLNLVRNQKNMK